MEKIFSLSEHNVVVCNDEKNALEKVRTVLTQLGYPVPITPSTSLRSIGLDSLDMVMLLCQLKIPSILKIKQSITLDSVDIVQNLIQTYLV